MGLQVLSSQPTVIIPRWTTYLDTLYDVCGTHGAGAAVLLTFRFAQVGEGWHAVFILCQGWRCLRCRVIFLRPLFRLVCCIRDTQQAPPTVTEATTKALWWLVAPLDYTWRWRFLAKK